MIKDRFPIFTENEVYSYIKAKRVNTLVINKAILTVFKIKPKNKDNFTNIYEKNILITKDKIKEITFQANRNIVMNILKYRNYGERMNHIDTFLTLEELLNDVEEQKKIWTLQIIDGYCFLELERIYKKSRQYIKKQVDEVIDNLTYRLI